MSERLRVAVVIQTPRDEHSAVYIGYKSLVTALESQGHSATILAPSDFPSLARFSGRWTPLLYPLAIAWWARGHGRGFDLVMFHSYSGWLAAVFGHGQPPALVMFHGIEPLYHRELREETARNGGSLSWRYRMLQELYLPNVLGLACRRAAGVACLNRTEAEFLTSNGWVSRANVHLLAHGVPPDFFAPPRTVRPARTLLFVGQWLPMKGIRYLRDAATVLLRGDAGMRLICAGTLVADDLVKAEFPSELRERIQVLPRVSQSTLPQLYRDADVFLFPSLYEGFSRAIVEAMASRLPIVCTPVGVAADALRHEHNALLVPKHDGAALVTAVQRVQSDPTLAGRLANAAAETARDYTQAAVLQRTMKVVVDAARQRS